MAQLKSSTSNEAKSDPSASLKHNFEPDDEEVSMIFGFEENDARQKLTNFPKCSRLVISPDLQAELGMEIGTAVSVEHPWREIKKEILEDHLPGKTKVQRQLKEKLKDMESGKLILVGYLPDQSTEEEDLFTVFTDNRETKEARELIRRLELVERLSAAAAMRKKARRWPSRGSERDVENFIPQLRTNVVNVESQSIFPAQRGATFRFRMRTVGEARDGYVELVPRTIFHNIVRKSVDFGVQLRPQKVHKFQQTDPTFPTNAWSQYLYEIGSDPRTAATATATVAVSTGSQTVGNTATSPVSASDHVEQLLQTLEFNQIDMYRNDYPIISRRKSIAKYETPIVEETMCFMDRATCANRHVSAIEWHPLLAGTFVAAYVHRIPCVDATLPYNVGGSVTPDAGARTKTPAPSGGREDPVNRLVFEKCPVLAWNFEESLVPKLWFDSPREVTALSFCPYDGRLLVGGLSSGQIAIWELTDVQLEHAGPRTVGVKEPARPGQHHPEVYRGEIKALLGNATPTTRFGRGRSATDGHPGQSGAPDGGAPAVPWHVRPAVISALERSARKPITVIRWLPQNYHCAPTGQLRVNGADDRPGQFLLTAALDGTVSFWNLDLTVAPGLAGHGGPDKEKVTAVPGSGGVGGDLDASAGERSGRGLARLNHVFHPTFRVRCDAPLVTLAFDEPPTARYGPPVPSSTVGPSPTTTVCRMAFIAGTLLGGLFWGKWDGYEFDQGATVNEEPVRDRDNFAAVHDGPLVAIARNAFVPDVLLTAGGCVLALWTVDCRQSPIFWRAKVAPVTACVWSLDRPSVFFVGLANGDLEIWDLQIHLSTACVGLNLGASVLSIITQQPHRRAATIGFHPHQHQQHQQQQHHLAVADGNCNVRLLSIPAAFAEPRPSERKRFRQLIRAELGRKHEQDAWVARYYEQNRERIEAKLKAEREARELAERLEVEKQEHDDFLRRQAIEEAKKKALRDAEKRVDLSRRLESRWRSRYYRALIRTMMARRNLSPELLAKQMYPERERRRYDVRKRATIGESVAAAPGDYARAQAALEPPELAGASRAERPPIAPMDGDGARLRETVRARFREELCDYPRVSWEAKEVLKNFRLPLELDSVVSIVAKGRARRDLVLSDDHGNLEHLQAYLAKQTARGSALGGEGCGEVGEGAPLSGGGTTNVSPEGRHPVGLQRARSVTFIDDVPKPTPELPG